MRNGITARSGDGACVHVSGADSAAPEAADAVRQRGSDKSRAGCCCCPLCSAFRARHAPGLAAGKERLPAPKEEREREGKKESRAVVVT